MLAENIGDEKLREGFLSAYTEDPEDDPYIQAAVLGGAAYVVSGDDDVLRMEDPPVPVLSLAQFVRLWEARLL